MKQNIGLEDRQFEREVGRFLDFTGKKYWRELIEQVDATDGPYYKYDFLLKRNPLITPIKQYMTLYNKGKSIWKNRSPEIDYLARTAFQLNHIIKRVSDRAKNEIKGRLKSDNIRSILCESALISHFIRNRFEIVFVEYERMNQGGRTFDFMVSKNKIKAEVECKYKSYDTGRKITRAAFALLCDSLAKNIEYPSNNYLLEIICAQSLTKNQETLLRITEKINAAIKNGEPDISIDSELRIKITKFANAERIDSLVRLEQVVEPYRTFNSHFAALSNSRSTIILKIESEKKERILRAIYEALKDSLDQFSKTRPGLIACHIEGVLPNEWKELTEKMVLRI